MTEATVPVHVERSVPRQHASPFAVLRQEIDRLFDGFSCNLPAFAGNSALRQMTFGLLT
ncbi:hypothetical protein MTX26_01585 [Bradyrhizobium sp. ISRA443]|uniref:hypothetical protein n=1 Tax=unclassified Bradyrhizobium TaxID=2631580 RepID=UPI002478789B|nr:MULTISPECIES: hypothetical protein [unclassified Bradyrhizobium]WGR94767.1 hypothetical protein MTX20_11625 [Bradyrhizobium sp. ISRA435]WGR99592.1 hypothetical protein MTX23_01585 [Bradyrhizobium sp. ISRA436]WGS06482.1 hypothetical protein MTX18_01585 [Bradyrhizobium sp. ISRA437]WGS13366.1 hypothetical protein MTX26_01585 [Bradyrhizobium sp. ISRA443]